MNTLEEKEQITQLSNKDLLGFFVSAVGHAYKKDYAPAIYPDFDEHTAALWGEVEHRLNEPRVLDFDRDGYIAELREEISEQGKLCRTVDSTTSYHYGIKSGLNIALTLLARYTKRSIL